MSLSRTESQSVVRQMESLFDGGSITGLTDRSLLERFVDRHGALGEEAFTALVHRHGPMVLETCRAILGDWQDAEDAFQAVFLVLARKARSLREPDLVGYWLHGVALRTARKARARRVRQRMNEGGAMRTRGPCSDPTVTLEDCAQPAGQALCDREDAEALHAEIERLARSFRLPVVLCYFEGLTLDEAAQRLGCPPGTVRSRLARARHKLRRGLSRRGVAPMGAALGAAIAPRSATARISGQLCSVTARGAIDLAAGKLGGGRMSAVAKALAEDVVRSMLWHKLSVVTLCLLLITTAAAAGYQLQSAFAPRGRATHALFQLGRSLALAR